MKKNPLKPLRLVGAKEDIASFILAENREYQNSIRTESQSSHMFKLDTRTHQLIVVVYGVTTSQREYILVGDVKSDVLIFFSL